MNMHFCGRPGATPALVGRAFIQALGASPAPVLLPFARRAGTHHRVGRAALSQDMVEYQLRQELLDQPPPLPSLAEELLSLSIPSLAKGAEPASVRRALAVLVVSAVALIVTLPHLPEYWRFREDASALPAAPLGTMLAMFLIVLAAWSQFGVRGAPACPPNE